MTIPQQYVYLIANIPLAIVWAVLYAHRPDRRKEIRAMSVLIGVLSVITAYVWWTVDWWEPTTILGTAVGIEDFLIGFTSGGIMTVIYEEPFHRLRKALCCPSHYPDILSVVLLVANITAFLFWGYRLTSFLASTIAMIVGIILMTYFRRDLAINGLFSGIGMVIISLSFYSTILLLSPSWIAATYHWDHLSGIRIFQIPVEEFVFWFLAGFIVGPFYEYWQRVRLVSSIDRTR